MGTLIWTIALIVGTICMFLIGLSIASMLLRPVVEIMNSIH